MGILRNSTNIPDKLVAICVAFAMPPDCAELISSIVIKNKRRGKVHGRWGWYYISDGKVVIIVPRRITRPHASIRRYSRRKLIITSRADFLVAILAHEMRHAWQEKHWRTPASQWKLGKDRLGKFAREADAEHYECDTIQKWRVEFGTLNFSG